MTRHDPPPRREQGAALLTVLLLVAVMAVIAAAALERLTLATRLSANVGALDQARAFADSATILIERRLTSFVGQTGSEAARSGDWQGRAQALAVPGGSVSVTLYDGGNCFNLNSLVAGEYEDDLKQRPLAISQFSSLMQALGVRPGEAQRVAIAAADWIDSDSVPAQGGAEDETYLAGDTAYRAANRRMVDISELRAVAGVSPVIYGVLRPWLCALPTSDLSPVNVNSLTPDQAPLLAMLVPGKLTIDKARTLILQRPSGGYDSTVTFWKGLGDVTPPAEAGEQIVLAPRWFRGDVVVDLGDTHMRQSALFDARRNPVKLVRSLWENEG